MATVNVEQNSWLQLTELLEFQDYLFWDQTEYPDIPFDENDTYLQLTQQQALRLDLLAFDTYGDATLIWVIQLANNLELPNQAREGMILRLPAKETIDNILKKQET